MNTFKFTTISRDVIRQSIKGRKTPQPLTKDVIFMAYWINVIGFVFRNFNQKGGNPPKGGKITCLNISKLLLLTDHTGS